MMPKGHYENAERHLWTVDRIREAIAAFQARSGRMPHPHEWQAAYGLPGQETVKRVCGSIGAVLETFGLSEEVRVAPTDRPYHFASGKRRARHADAP